MKRKITAFFLCIGLIFLSVSVRAEVPALSAQAAVLYDPRTETVLFSQNAEEVRPMASTTKIMTALLAYESGRLSEPVEITEEMTAVEGSSMGLMPGDILTLRDLTAGMLLASGNDGANAAALFLGGDALRFSEMMNMRAAELGMENTVFVTPSGLDAEGHGSTALDMARLAAAAMENPEFRETVGQIAVSVSFLKPEKTVRYENHNRLLTLYDGCTGIKTGYTKKAGRCLVSAAERNGAELICVTLNAPDDWNDHIRLFDWGFSQYTRRALPVEDGARTVPVVGGAENSVLCRAESVAEVSLREEDQVETAVELPRFVYAPVSAGDVLGQIVYRVHGKELARVPLIAGSSVPAAEIKQNWIKKWIKSLFSEG